MAFHSLRLSGCCLLPPVLAVHRQVSPRAGTYKAPQPRPRLFLVPLSAPAYPASSPLAADFSLGGDGDESPAKAHRGCMRFVQCRSPLLLSFSDAGPIEGLATGAGVRKA